ncbi:hypothetical protein [Massilia eburnea]|uniref:hypothetical protein n=1 Tax=Massilia eburnea TaxID=1776165 RepID=UPI003D6C166B
MGAPVRRGSLRIEAHLRLLALRGIGSQLGPGGGGIAAFGDQGAALGLDLPHIFPGAQAPDVIAAGKQFELQAFQRHLAQGNRALAFRQARRHQRVLRVFFPEKFLLPPHGQRVFARAVRVESCGIINAASQQKQRHDSQDFAHGR